MKIEEAKISELLTNAWARLFKKNYENSPKPKPAPEIKFPRYKDLKKS